MKANNSITKSSVARPSSGKISFSTLITSDSWKNMINKSIGDPNRAASFTSTLISAVSSSAQLSACKPESIISAALKGEAMNLRLALGHFSIVPYGDNANFQISYKGLEQLATRSNLYDGFGVFDVREGEYKGKNKRTRQPDIEWIEDDDEREKLPLIGFYGYYELKNGFFNSIYWTHDKILTHADRYSKAFSKEKYEQILSGKMDKKEADSLRRGSPWYDDPLSEAHMKMCKKTLLIQLLNDGAAPLSIELISAFRQDSYVEAGQEIIYDDMPVISANMVQQSDVVDETATVVESNPSSGEQMSLQDMESK